MRNQNTKRLAGISLLIAIVVVLQFMGSFIKFGLFSVSLVLVPIVVGSALYGPITGAILGFIFSLIVLLTDSTFFLAYNPVGTIITVLLKGTLAGYCAGLVYNLFESKKQNLAVLLSSITAPIVNTGIFVLGCMIFFVPLLQTISNGQDVLSYVLFGMIGTNFLVELIVNVALSNVILVLINYGRKDHRSKELH